MATRFEKILYACGEEMGKLAFAAGVQAPALDPTFRAAMKGLKPSQFAALAKGWLSGWTYANLAAELIDSK